MIGMFFGLIGVGAAAFEAGRLYGKHNGNFESVKKDLKQTADWFTAKARESGQKMRTEFRSILEDARNEAGKKRKTEKTAGRTGPRRKKPATA